MSDDVDEGLDVCTEENGVRNGMIARWVKTSFLVSEEPAKAKPMSDAENWVSGSTDFSTHREVFGDAAQRLVDLGDCTPQDFTEMGGWTASDLGAGNYFIWCKNLTVKHYLDAETGQLR